MKKQNNCASCKELRKRIAELQYYDTSKITLAKKQAYIEVLNFIKDYLKGNISADCLLALIKFLEDKIK